MTITMAASFKLLALTGQREKEIGDLRRSEIHDAAIFLPKERTKNKRPHVVPLSPAALAHRRGAGAARRPRPDIRQRGWRFFRLVKIERAIG